MNTLTSQIDNLNKRVVALENSELSETESVPFIVKLYATFNTTSALRCSTIAKVKTGQKMSAGSAGAADDLAVKLNYGAVGTGAVPAPGSIGVPNEVARKPVGTVTTVESSGTETVIVLSTYFDEQTANDQLLTSAAALYDATGTVGTGKVVTSSAINIDKTSASTLTVSTEITIREV
jgi:hypothetical protein